MENIDPDEDDCGANRNNASYFRSDIDINKTTIMGQGQQQTNNGTVNKLIESM